MLSRPSRIPKQKWLIKKVQKNTPTQPNSSLKNNTQEEIILPINEVRTIYFLENEFGIFTKFFNK
jgi:hypothetical protein